MKKTTALALAGILILAAGAGIFTAHVLKGTGASTHPALEKFSSEKQFMDAFKRGRDRQLGLMENARTFDTAMPAAAQPASGEKSGAPAPEHSETNVQVEGVDEADIVKSDGDYIYAISGNDVFIVKARPAEQAGVVARIGVTDGERGGDLSEMFVFEKKLAVIGASEYGPVRMGGVKEHGGRRAFVSVYGLQDPTRPVLLRTVEYEGYYSTARMLDGNVHVVLTTTPYEVLDEKDPRPPDIIPVYRDTRPEERTGPFEPAVGWDEIDAVDPKGFTSFLSVVSISLDDGSRKMEKRVIAGRSDDVYASPENLYVAAGERDYYFGWRDVPRDFEESTTVYKFKFDGPSVRYQSAGSVPGTILNQFSMDESGGNFRIATTRGQVRGESPDSTNNVYVLGPDMEIAGRLEGLAPGEKIYSARFMGDRGYLVTFKKVDPLFVLDLSNPAAPVVLGQLKIPGYSDYLHPYDENHIIGVGKNAAEPTAEEARGMNFAWYQGMKIAIFDVSDVANPKEMHKVEIGDRGTDSYALQDHKAFLFDRARNLMVLPVLLAELTPEQKADPNRSGSAYGEFKFQGADVYDVSLEGGFKLKGRITHVAAGQEMGDDYGYGYYGSEDSVRRSLWIEDDLYTYSASMIKANRLNDLAEVKAVELK